MRQRLFLTIALMISIVFLPNFSAWAVPYTINYQGKLTDADGNALNGEYTMTFRLYRIAESETSIWDETQRVTATEGIYNVKLGAKNPMEASLFDNDDNVELYLEVEIEGEILSPRQFLTSTAFAMRAADADTLEGVSINELEESDEINTKLAEHSAEPNVHHNKTTSFAELTDMAIDSQIPSDITINYAAQAGNSDTLDGKHANEFGDGHSLDADNGIPVDVVYVDKNGNVGIGITNPLQKLSVTGIIESINGGFKFPDGTVQITAINDNSYDVYLVNSINRLRELIGTVYKKIAAVTGYWKDSDGGGGIFYWDADEPADNDDGGTIIHPDSSGDHGCWRRFYNNTVNVMWFGADPTGSQDSTDAILRAIVALGEGNSSSGANGGKIKFPKGKFRFTRLDISDHANVTFEGEGSRYGENFKTPETALFYEGDGTGSPDDYALRLSTNYARGWRFKDLHLAYVNNDPLKPFIGDLIRVETPAVQFDNVSFGDMSVKGPDAIYSAHSMVLVTNSELATFTRCTFDMCQRGIWVPQASMQSNAMIIRDSIFYDCRYAALEYERGGNHGLLMQGCGVDPIRGARPQYGIIVHVNGFAIIGCCFAGSSTVFSPVNSFVKLNGRGVFHGNVILTDGKGIEVASAVDIRGNFISAETPIDIRLGNVTGGSNEYRRAGSGQYAVQIANPYKAAVAVDMGPDCVGAGFSNSYFVGSSNEAVYGKIKYNPFFDASANGPSLGPNVSLSQLRRRVLDKIGDYNVTKKEHRCTLSNAGSLGTITFTLPKAEPGLEFTFINREARQVIIKSHSKDRILSLGSGGVLSITNNSERNAMVRLRAINIVHWVPELLAGTWN